MDEARVTAAFILWGPEPRGGATIPGATLGVVFVVAVYLLSVFSFDFNVDGCSVGPDEMPNEIVRGATRFESDASR